MSTFHYAYEVYRFYGADDTLLYVGVTRDFQSRLYTHKSGSPWFGEVARIERREYDTPDEAADAEIGAISNLAPRYNRHRSGALTRSWAGRWNRRSPV